MKFENTSVFNLDGAIRGMRNPLQSWSKSDSHYSNGDKKYVIGENDMKLMKNLLRAGSSDAKFMRQIMVCVDITAPLFWFSEFDTYKVGTVANSTSTMHTIHKDNITRDSFDFKYGVDEFADRFMDSAIDLINDLQVKMNSVGDKNARNDIRELIKGVLPSSFMQTRTWTSNYAVLRNMYQQRKNHRLSEWRCDFCEWVKSLPYNELITEDFNN